MESALSSTSLLFSSACILRSSSELFSASVVALAVNVSVNCVLPVISLSKSRRISVTVCVMLASATRLSFVSAKSSLAEAISSEPITYVKEPSASLRSVSVKCVACGSSSSLVFASFLAASIAAATPVSLRPCSSTERKLFSLLASSSFIENSSPLSLRPFPATYGFIISNIGILVSDFSDCVFHTNRRYGNTFWLYPSGSRSACSSALCMISTFSSNPSLTNIEASNVSITVSSAPINMSVLLASS